MHDKVLNFLGETFISGYGCREGRVLFVDLAYVLEFIGVWRWSLGPPESFGNAILRKLPWSETVLISQFQPATFS